MTAQIHDIADERLKRALTQDHIDVAEEVFDDLPEEYHFHFDLPDQPPVNAGQAVWQFIIGFAMGVMIVTCLVTLAG